MKYLLKKTIWDRDGNIYHPSQTPYREGELSKELLEKHKEHIVVLNEDEVPVFKKISEVEEPIVDTQVSDTDTNSDVTLNKEIYDLSEVKVLKKKNLNTLTEEEMTNSKDFNFKVKEAVLKHRPFIDWESFKTKVKPNKDYRQLGYVIEYEKKQTNS